jgi:hypothetical protein
MKKILLMLLLSTFAVQAEVYRWLDENGNVIFSDEPHPNGEKVELKQPSTYSPVQIPTEKAAAEPSTSEQVGEEKEAPNYRVRLISPENDQAFWENSGTVTLVARVSPKLDQDRDDQFLFYLNGKEVGGRQSSSSLTVPNVERGTHSASVAIVDSSGAALSSSKTITFHLKRRSVNN